MATNLQKKETNTKTMITYSTILQGHEATEENARDLARGFDFSQSETEEYNRNLMYDDYIDTINGVDIYYNTRADYYFFAPEEPLIMEETEKQFIELLDKYRKLFNTDAITYSEHHDSILYDIQGYAEVACSDDEEYIKDEMGHLKAQVESVELLVKALDGFTTRYA